MPRFDGTGPLGEGPMTGGGFGPCGRGLRRGAGRGLGFGRGLGRGRGFRFWGTSSTYSPDNEIEALKREKELIEKEIAALEQKR